MPATHRIETAVYNPGSLDDFIKALRSIGFIVTQERNVIDNVEYSHYAKWPNASFDDGIYFYYTAEHTEIVDEQERHYNSSITGRISKFRNVGFTINGRQQHSENTSYSYKIPYVLSTDGGVIIKGLGYFEETNSQTQRTYATSGPLLFILPSTEIDSGWDFGVNFFTHVYQGSTCVSYLYESIGRTFYTTAYQGGWCDGGKNIFSPMITYYNGTDTDWITSCLYTFISHRLFKAISYGELQTAVGSMGSIFKDSDNNEYFVTGGGQQTPNIYAIKL